jgi:hypothetical protein
MINDSFIAIKITTGIFRSLSGSRDHMPKKQKLQAIAGNAKKAETTGNSK